jgi:aminopeptidase-like protein
VNISDFDFNTVDHEDIGESAYRLVRQLYPICRSITGNGVRETLRIIGSQIRLNLCEVATGTRVFDWVVPKEWNVQDAYVADSEGFRVIDFRLSNLHVVNYSVPVKAKLKRAELLPHLFTLPDHPDWIPYKTSYYKETWGFCLSHRALQNLGESEYEVCIDSSLKDGSLTYGECYIRGNTDSEFLISCHICHPSLCNDNLSGVALATLLAKHLNTLQLRYSYRFLFIPGTIGAITWLCLNEENLSRIRHGLVVACVGDAGKFHYKKSRRGNAEIDRAVVHILKYSGQEHEILEFSPYGYDERQYCSPGINLPVGSLTRTPHGRYPQYHTSADDLSFITARNLAESASQFLGVIHVIENNGRYVNLNPKCEPQLGRRGLYGQMGGHGQREDLELAMLWILNLSDGSNSLLDIADRAGICFRRIWQAAKMLIQNKLLTTSD